MARPRIILADTDEGYLISLQHKFIEEFFEKIDLEVVSDREYYDALFEMPQKADILVVSEDLYDIGIQKHNIGHVFVMTESNEEEGTADLKVDRIFKYSSIKEVFNEIISKTGDSLNLASEGKQDPQIIVVTSAMGGVGKTTLAMGLSACLTREYKKVLYINADHLQCFSYLLKNPSPISNNEIYSKLVLGSGNPYQELRHQIRNEVFSYVPPFKAALLSLGIPANIFARIAECAKRSGDYDYVVVDTNSTFDERKAELLEMADKVIVVTRQSKASKASTDQLVASINGVSSEKYLFICNDLPKEQIQLISSTEQTGRYRINEYIEHIKEYDQLTGADLANQPSIRKVVYLLD